MSDNPTKTESRLYHGIAWVVRYWWTENDKTAGPEQTAHFLDSLYNYDEQLSYAAAIAYAARPSTAGRPVRRVEISRTRFGASDNRE